VLLFFTGIVIASAGCSTATTYYTRAIGRRVGGGL